MDDEQIKQINICLDTLENKPVSVQEAESHIVKLLSNILTPLFQFDGYATRDLTREDSLIDFVASKRSHDPDIPPVIGIRYKHYGKNHRIGVSEVDKAGQYRERSDLHRIVILSNRGFTKAAAESAERQIPPIFLWNFSDLRAWVSRIERDYKEDHSLVIRAIVDVSKLLAKIIAENPSEINYMEWRDMERMLAEVFEGFGFKVELTPPSKDGGKDIILACTVKGKEHSYIVEVKHWRSGQRVGKNAAKEFTKVIARENRQGGLFLSTYGYCDNAFESLTESERVSVRFGEQEKIRLLCKTYVKAESLLWKPVSPLPELLYDATKSV